MLFHGLQKFIVTHIKMLQSQLIHTLVTQRCAVSFGELLQFVVVCQNEKCSLDTIHLLHLGHHVLINTIHDLL